MHWPLRGREHCIGNRGGNWRYPGFTYAAGILLARNDIDLDAGHGVHTQKPVAIEIALLHTPSLDGDFSIQSRAESKDNSALHLSFNGAGINCDSTIDGANQAMDGRRAIIFHAD